ncbi:Gamma-tubulin complex component 6 [Armadillidium nasatum]|uniref:Gamma-tubulin complex component n=1 Tax=Armadillidium nasatum TaxID=96803 RepID=A0A5N5T9T0_9CRUS|nr:Gamma-tubulin complex component 6 [Armadillidium nasatum]
MKFNYKKENYFRKEHIDPTVNRNSMDIDTESVSQMSVSSDLVETPIEDYIPLTETIEEERECIIENDKASVDNLNNLISSICDETEKIVSVDVTQEVKNENLNNNISNDFNSKNIESLLIKESDDFSNNNSNIVSSDFNSNKLEDKSENVPHDGKPNQISETVGVSRNDLISERNKTTNTQYLELNSKTVSKDSPEEKEEGNIKGMTIGIRKSKSESISLKDSDLKIKKQKGTNRYSLYDFQEAPVLIDQVGGETLKWRGRSIYGHASDSVIQKILWGNTDENVENSDKECLSKVSFLNEELRKHISSADTTVVRPYSLILKEENKCPVKMSIPYSKSEECVEDSNETTLEDIHNTILTFTPLYIARGISEHLKVQSKLANEALLSHFYVERKLLDHFSSLKKFLLLHDASFARTLIRNLISKFVFGRPSPYFVSPVELNLILNEAIVASSSPKHSFASNLYFNVTNLTRNSYSDPLDTIGLRYSVEWPLCVILDEKVLSLYSSVSKFLVRLHQVMLTIEDAFRYMISLRSRFTKIEGIHYHQINIFRHEVQQLVHVIFGYISHQAIEGSWSHFQKRLRDNVTTLDDLYHSHFQFIEEVNENNT